MVLLLPECYRSISGAIRPAPGWEATHAHDTARSIHVEGSSEETTRIRALDTAFEIDGAADGEVIPVP